MASKLFEASRKPELFERLLGDLFRKMADGELDGRPDPHVNGSLFDDAATIRPLDELGCWRRRRVSTGARSATSIFGTLFGAGWIRRSARSWGITRARRTSKRWWSRW
ncbi:MAG: hypothetical protein R2862_08955 [Thermoanaerobaculia bacterium]